jgi:hypothetical protein
MTEEQTNQAQTSPCRESHYSLRSQERHERHMAKQAAREARRAARAQRPRRDWTIEMKLGEKVYTFNWRWQPVESQAEPDVEETQTPLPEADSEPAAE